MSLDQDEQAAMIELERDELRVELDKLRCAYGNVCDNAAITEKERDHLAAKCAAAFVKLDSVKVTLAYVSHQRLPLGDTVMDTLPEHWQLSVHKALDRELSDFGTSWLSPEKAQRLRAELEKLLVHAIEFYNDWKKGDFALCKLAECDMESMANQFKSAKQALDEIQ